jgi:hypothetical protein
MIYRYKIVQFTGKLEWAEQKLGSGGTYTLLIIIGFGDLDWLHDVCPRFFRSIVWIFGQILLKRYFGLVGFVSWLPDAVLSNLSRNKVKKV